MFINIYADTCLLIFTPRHICLLIFTKTPSVLFIHRHVYLYLHRHPVCIYT